MCSLSGPESGFNETPSQINNEQSGSRTSIKYKTLTLSSTSIDDELQAEHNLCLLICVFLCPPNDSWLEQIKSFSSTAHRL